MRELPRPNEQRVGNSRDVVERNAPVAAVDRLQSVMRSFRQRVTDDNRAARRSTLLQSSKQNKTADLISGMGITSDDLVTNVQLQNKILRDIINSLDGRGSPGIDLNGRRQRGSRSATRPRPSSVQRRNASRRLNPPAPRRDARRIQRERARASAIRRQSTTPQAEVRQRSSAVTPRVRPAAPTVLQTPNVPTPRPPPAVQDAIRPPTSFQAPDVPRPSTRPRVTGAGLGGAIVGGTFGTLEGNATTGAIVGGAAAAGISAGTQLADQSIRRMLTTRVTDSIASRVATKIPVAGLLVSLFFAGQRAAANDWVGAGLEVSAGAAGALGPLTFGIGTGVALGIDALSLSRDLYSAVYGINIEDDPQSSERLSALQTTIGEIIGEIIANRPRPVTPVINTETRDKLLELYRAIGDDEDSIRLVGPDVLAGIRGLLSVNIEGDGLRARAARESMANVLSGLQNRLATTTRSNLETPLSMLPDNELGPVKDAVAVSRDSVTGIDDSNVRTSSSDLPYPENLIDMLSRTEFNELTIEAEDIIFDGEVSIARDTTPTIRPSPAQQPSFTNTNDSDITPIPISASATPAAAANPVAATPSVTPSVSTAGAAAPSSTPSATPVAGEMAMPSIVTAPAAPGAVTSSAPASSAAPTGDSSQGQITQILQEGPGFNIVRYLDGRVERRTGSFNWRNNNPGNLRMTPFSRRMGAIGGGTFAIFPTYEAGKRAKEALIFESSPYRNLTIAQAISRYAPPSENNTAAYINSVVQATGATPDTPTQSLTPAQRTSMLNAIDRIEGFRVGRVDVLQQPTSQTAATPAATPAPGVATTGASLNTAGTEVAVDDQARLRNSGAAPSVIVTPPNVNAPVSNTTQARTAMGEVPLNRRLESQVV